MKPSAMRRANVRMQATRPPAPRLPPIPREPPSLKVASLQRWMDLNA